MKTSKILLMLSLLAGTGAYARDNIMLTLEGGVCMDFNRADVVDMQVLVPPPPPAHVAVDARVPLGDHVTLRVESGRREPPPPAYKIVVLRMRDGRELRYNAYDIKEVHIDEPPPPPERPSIGLTIVIGERDHWDRSRDYWYNDHWERWDNGRWVITKDHHDDYDRNHWDREHDHWYHDHWERWDNGHWVITKNHREDHDKGHDRDRDRDHDKDRKPDRDHDKDHRPDVHPQPQPQHPDHKPDMKPDHKPDVKPAPKPDKKHDEKPKKDKKDKDKKDKKDDDSNNPNAGHKLNNDNH